jgi:Na+-driven multidrug efflux pump
MVKVDDRPQMAIIGVSTSVVTNIGLDYLFVLVFDWGVKGAAWATGLAQLVSLTLFLCYFFSKKSHLKIGKFPWRPKIFLRTLPLGIADCSVEVIMAWLTLLYNHLLRNLFGESSMTIYAVIAYFNLLVFMMMQGVAQGMMHLVSLQLGKGDVKSAAGYFRMSILCNLTLGIVLLVLCQIMPELFVGMLLKADSPMFEQTLHAVQQFSLSFPLVGLNIAAAGYFTARELPLPSISLALGRGFVFAPSALFLCAFLAGGQFIWLAAVLGEAACLLVSVYFLLRWKDARPKELRATC